MGQIKRVKIGRENKYNKKLKYQKKVLRHMLQYKNGINHHQDLKNRMKAVIIVLLIHQNHIP